MKLKIVFKSDVNIRKRRVLTVEDVEVNEKFLIIRNDGHGEVYIQLSEIAYVILDEEPFYNSEYTNYIY